MVTNTYKRHRFQTDIISYAVWLYFRFNLSHRDIEDILAERGVTVSDETVRLWCIKFGGLQEVAETTLLSRADSWYMGANIHGKPSCLLSFPGSQDYREAVEQSAAEGYSGFTLG